MRTPRAVVTAGLLLLASAGSAAQLQGPAPFPIADDNLSALAAGDFSGDRHMDAVVLANGKPVLRSEVEAQQTHVWADLTAVDIATLSGTGAGGRDQLVAVGPDGLSLLEVQSLATAPWSVTNLRGSGTWWKNAVAVRTGQVDGLQGDDIVAVTYNRVLIACSNGAGGWMSDLVFMAGGAITGLELVDWDGAPGGGHEIAVLMAALSGLPARLRIMRPDGTSLGTIYSHSDRIIAAPLSAPGIGTRYLASVGTVNATGAQEFALLAADDLDGPWDIGHAGVYDMVAGDWTGDGIDDLVLATNESRDAQLYVVVSDQPSRLSLDPLDTPPNPPEPLPVGHPARNPAVQDGGMALADVDHDGDRDLIAAVQGDYRGGSYVHLDPHFSSVERTLNHTVDENEFLPWPVREPEWPEALPLPQHSVVSGAWYIALPTPTELLDDDPEFEYVVWRTPAMESLLDAAPIIADKAEIGESSGGGLTWTTLTLPVGEYGLYFPARYTLVVRQVSRDTGDAIVAQSPALLLTFYSELDDELYASGWNVITSGPAQVIDGWEPGESGGHSQGAPPPPPPPNP
jgi:hypothetical protein